MQLPGSDTGLFRCLFEALEAHAESVGVEDFGVNTTTLEDVFLKVNQLVLDTAPRDTTQAEGTSDLRLLTDSGVRGTLTLSLTPSLPLPLTRDPTLTLAATLTLPLTRYASAGRSLGHARQEANHPSPHPQA